MWPNGESEQSGAPGGLAGGMTVGAGAGGMVLLVAIVVAAGVELILGL